MYMNAIKILLIINQYTAFVKLNSSGITYYLCLLRAPVSTSKTKQVNKTQTRMFIGDIRIIF